MSSENKKHSFSKRAAALLNVQELRFAESLVPQSDFRWKIEYNGEGAQLQSDKILTLKYSSPVVNNDLENIFLESICRLSKEKTLRFLFSLSYREIESFLRDENHVPAFSSEVIDEASVVLARVKKSLLVEILLQKLTRPIDFDWNKLTLAGKNRAVSSLFSELEKAFSEGKKIELVLAEDSIVTVKNNDFPLDLEIVEALMGQIFFPHESISPLKVIGTL